MSKELLKHLRSANKLDGDIRNLWVKVYEGTHGVSFKVEFHAYGKRPLYGEGQSLDVAIAEALGKLECTQMVLL